MGNTQEQELQKALAAADMYQLLSLSMHLPTEEMARGLLEGTLTEDVQKIFGELGFTNEVIENITTDFEALQNNAATTKGLLTEMRREYTRLFTNPEKPAVAIYETLFLYQPEEENGVKPALFISPAALDAERCYKKAGFTRSKEINEPGDHMATELEFIMLLYYQKVKFLEEDNQEEIAKKNEQIKEFSKVHLQKWAIDFFDRCISASESNVYRTFGQIGSTFMSKMLES